MKWIKKSEEPENFKGWKSQANEDWQPTWDELRSPEKPQLHESLLQEQGYLCCYCQRRIELKNSHVEHFKPRTHYPELALDYHNLLASCQEERKKNEPPPKPTHCGHYKKDWYDPELLVSPLEKNCEQSFRYTELGEIRPNSDPNFKQAAETTIEKLGLNIDKLRAMRQEAIADITKVLDELNESDKQQLIAGFTTPNSEGKYDEFCMALVYILRQYY